MKAPSEARPLNGGGRGLEDGGTTFNFVTDGIESAMARAQEAAGDADVAVAGGAQTVNQYLAAGLMDELRLHVAPIVLGAGSGCSRTSAISRSNRSRSPTPTWSRT